MHPVRACYLEIIEHKTQQILSRVVLGINGSEMLGDSHFIVYLGCIFLRDADLEGQKEVFSSYGIGSLAKANEKLTGWSA
jgi:hypothetical protein